MSDGQGHTRRFVLAADGLAFGSLALVWIDVALFVVPAAGRIKLHVWGDFVSDKRQLPR